MLAEETLKPLVEKALSRSMDASLHLGDELPIADGKRHHVHRFPVLDGPLSAPGSVVVKTALMFGDEVYDPDSTAPMAPARRLF